MSHKLVPGAQYSWNSPKQHGGHSFVLFQIRHFSSTLITILSQEHHFKKTAVGMQFPYFFLYKMNQNYCKEMAQSQLYFKATSNAGAFKFTIL